MELEQFVLAHEPAIRLSFFLGAFALVALCEGLAPRRALVLSRALRWTSNLGLAALNTVLLRLLFPLAAVGVAAVGVAHGWGLLNHFVVPFWVAVPVALTPVRTCLKLVCAGTSVTSHCLNSSKAPGNKKPRLGGVFLCLDLLR